MPLKNLKIDGQSLTLNQIEEFIYNSPTVSLTKEAKKKVNKARTLIDKWVESGEVIYGVTTGFGGFSSIKISNKDIKKLQENLIISHTVGVGDNLPPIIVKIKATL